MREVGIKNDYCNLCGERLFRELQHDYDYEGAYRDDVIEGTALHIEYHLKKRHGLNMDLFTDKGPYWVTDFNTDYRVEVVEQ